MTIAYGLCEASEGEKVIILSDRITELLDIAGLKFLMLSGILEDRF